MRTRLFFVSCFLLLSCRSRTEVQRPDTTQAKVAQDTTDAQCPDAITTFDMNECMKEVMAKADERLASVTAQARARMSRDLVSRFDSVALSWEAHRRAHCRLYYDHFAGGTIAGVSFAQCMVNLADSRAEHLTLEYLSQ